MSTTIDLNAPISFRSQVLDNVHGFISYTEDEWKIMNTKLFKRLQSIKQLSVVNWVFPGSEHTRYIHSLGVMHIADKMAIAMKLENRDRRILRMAGLLHDIGHYPLSHVGEMPYRNLKIKDGLMKITDPVEFCRAVNDEVVQQISENHIKVKTTMMKPSDGLHHEAVGAEIIKNNKEIRKIVEEALGEGAAEVIANIITGNVNDGPNALMKTDPLWVQIMHSELDADGIDYLMRDSVFAGTSFGSCEIDQLIRCLTVGIDPKSGERIMCIKPKGIPAADQYLVNKFFHYSQVVFNRHITISEWMAKKVIRWMQDNYLQINEKWCFPNRARMLQWMKEGGPEAYIRFTDNQFWTAIDEISRKRKNVPPHIKRFCKYLLNHDEPELAKEDEIRIVSRDNDRIQDALKQSDTWNKPETRGEWITVLDSRTMSGQMRQEEFDRRMQERLEKDIVKDEDLPEEEAKRQAALRNNEAVHDSIEKDRLFRLMECICVRERIELDENKKEKPHVIRPLCDHERSIMQDNYNETITILRSYKYHAK